MVTIVANSFLSIFNNNNNNPFSLLEEEDLLTRTPTKLIVFDRVTRINFSFFGQNLDPIANPAKGTLGRITNARGLSVTGFTSPLVDWVDVFAGRRTFNSLIAEIQSGRDNITGSRGNDRLYGYNGNDFISGQAGGDLLSGGAGNDTVIGGSGFDNIFGGNGNDILRGQSGGDSLNGGSGVDSAQYQGSIGVTVSLASGRGTKGDAQGDVLTNIENLTGSSFADKLIGDSKNNTLIGQSGIDSLVGGNGNDILVGGANADVLQGGKGADQFLYQSRSNSLLTNRDRITGLTIGIDKINFPTAISKNKIVQKGKINTFSQAQIKSLLSNSFPRNGGATFKFGSRTYLAVNDNRGGFQSSTDSIIEITGFSGALSNLSII